MYYKVKVFTEAGQDAVVDDGGARITIYTRRPPKQNAANEDILRLLGKHLSIQKSKLRIVTGHRAPHKTIEVVGTISKS